MRFVAVLLLLFSLGLGRVAHAQGSETPPSDGSVGDFAGLFSFGKATTSAVPCNYVLKYNLGRDGVPCTFDNGHARGSGLNSGIISMDAQAGGGIKFDLTEITKSWGGAFAKGWNFLFYQMLRISLVGFALVTAFMFVSYWIRKWPDMKGGS